MGDCVVDGRGGEGVREGCVLDYANVNSYAYMIVHIYKSLYLYIARDGGTGWRVSGEGPKMRANQILDRDGVMVATDSDDIVEVAYMDCVWEVWLWWNGEVRE